MDKALRVLVLITKMDRGGAETFVMNYLRNFDRSKVQYDFLVNRQEPGDYEDEIQDLGGRIFRMCPMYPQYFSQYKREFRQFLVEHPEYTIIHSNLEERSYFPLRVAADMHVPVRIAHAHSARHDFDIKTPFREYFRHRIGPYPTDKFACSRQAGVWLYGGKGVEAKNFKVVRNAIDLKKYSFNRAIRDKYRAKLGLQNKLVIGNVGRLSKEKNHLFLLQTFQQIHQRNPNSALLLVGGGPLQESLARKVHELGLSDSVHFTGSVPDVWSYLQAMDVFVFPSSFEGLGMSVIEAQAAGLPCIVSDRVPHEVQMTENVEFFSLKDSVSRWSREAMQLSTFRRKDEVSAVRAHGYDIATEAKKLQNFYLQAAMR
ncbi:putative glycosyltransferase EpsF [Bombiscardovia nodaiensis]|uniref:Glycosyltransferase EpsF n=1 Tax=Bombiscardovia nodaiensis TaxID=2932181 RepID=A0ABM8BAN8_9BIFI|nr:putative glycosyltransferase EpsF [Bombiscardovia nodaiensis]